MTNDIWAQLEEEGKIIKEQKEQITDLVAAGERYMMVNMEYHEALKQQNAELVAALEELLIVAKHYKPIPKGYNPEDEDEEMWAIGQVYYQAEQALAQVKEE